MNKLVQDSTRNVAVFINDFDQEFADGLKKLSDTLNRPLRGIILVDQDVKSFNRNTPDTASVFEQIVCDFSNDAGLHAAIKPFHDNLLLVTCSSERNQPYLQRVLPHMPYILGPTESSLSWSTHKGKMRELLGSYDERLVPKVQMVTNDEEAEIQKVLSALSFPLILKPTGLASSILVSKVHDEHELRTVLKKSFSVIRDVYARDRGRGNPEMIAEEFIDGDMYSVDVYVNETGAVSPLPLLRSKTADALGLEGFYTFQTDSYLEIGAEDIAAGHAASAQAAHALGLRSCVAHVELFRTQHGWKIIELGPRAGGQRQDIYYVSYGIDHAYNELLTKVGLPPEINTNPIAYSTTINFYAEEEGTISSIDGVSEAQHNNSTYKLTFYAKPGDIAKKSSNGGKIVADGLLHNKDLSQLNSDADFVRSMIKINVQKS